MLDPEERLRQAVVSGNLPITKRLLSRFPELWLNPNPKNGWTNLHYASYHGNYLICFHLISFMNQNFGDLTNHYSELDLLTFDELSVLHTALSHHKSQTLHYLLQEFPGKIWLNYAGGPLRQAPLHYSCIHGFKEGVKLLLEFGANWSLQDASGNTCLHLCLEYGNFDCIAVIFKYIITAAKDRASSIANINQLECITNNKGWPAIEYASSFDLITRYELLKSELFVGVNDVNDAKEVQTHSDEFTPEPLENKILASPILPVSHKDNSPVGRRAHSQSLPSSYVVPEIRPKLQALRTRSNTAYSYKPPGALGAGAASVVSPRTSVPETPRVAKTPSLKSVTISPSVRTTSDVDDDDDESNSPSSLVSSGSFSNISPVHIVPTKPPGRKMSFSNKPFVQLPLPDEDTQWPQVRSSPNHIIAQTLPESGTVSEFHVPRSSFNSNTSSPVLASQKTPVEIFRTPSRHRSQTDLGRSFSPRNVRAELKSRSSSASSIAAKVAFNSSRSSLGETSSRGLHEESSPELRKTKSSGTIQQPINPLKSIVPKPPSPEKTASSGSSESLKRSNISSISFSRVR